MHFIQKYKIVKNNVQMDNNNNIITKPSYCAVSLRLLSNDSIKQTVVRVSEGSIYHLIKVMLTIV